jgi:hypothetical protein
MKKYSIFAAFKSGTFSSISKVAAFFIALNLAVTAANIGYQIPADCCTLQSVIVPDRTGGDSLSYFDTSFFRLHM